MRNHLLTGFQILFSCAVATVLAFAAACTVGAFANPATLMRPDLAIRNWMMFLIYGGVPCCSLGMGLALVCWALIPWVQRALRRLLTTTTRAQRGVPCTPGAALPGSVSSSFGVVSGMVTGVLVSFLNAPGYWALNMVGAPLMAFCFVGAGVVAGGILGWCRATAARPSPIRELFSGAVFLP